MFIQRSAGAQAGARSIDDLQLPICHGEDRRPVGLDEVGLKHSNFLHVGRGVGLRCLCATGIRAVLGEHDVLLALVKPQAIGPDLIKGIADVVVEKFVARSKHCARHARGVGLLGDRGGAAQQQSKGNAESPALHDRPVSSACGVGRWDER
nr:hypothetical protein [Ornithinimicrobium sp. INDO-MA30-4]